jgi:hypothetical protein
VLSVVSKIDRCRNIDGICTCEQPVEKTETIVCAVDAGDDNVSVSVDNATPYHEPIDLFIVFIFDVRTTTSTFLCTIDDLGADKAALGSTASSIATSSNATSSIATSSIATSSNATSHNNNRTQQLDIDSTTHHLVYSSKSKSSCYIACTPISSAAIGNHRKQQQQCIGICIAAYQSTDQQQQYEQSTRSTSAFSIHDVSAAIHGTGPSSLW